MRRFEEVEEKFKKFPNVKTELPERSDAGSAGYDLKSKENYTLKPGERHCFWTDVKSIQFIDNVLFIFARSGLGAKHGIVPGNCVGVIDASYAGNPDNDGNIGVCLVNNGDVDFEINVGDRIAQCVYTRLYITDTDKYNTGRKEYPGRSGGFGSSGR